MAIMKGNEGKMEMAVSLYQDEDASPRDIAVSMKRLELAFPNMERGFFDLLAERVIANGFTAERLKDAVNHVLDSTRSSTSRTSSALTAVQNSTPTSKYASW